jgi:co-chaperonin GroES (HSP10)
MSKVFLEPASDHVLVVDMPQTTIIDGIEMPDNEKQKEMMFGTVVYVGPLAKNTEPENRVVYGYYAGKTIVIQGVEFRLLLEGQIEAYIRQTE